jgi:hypothetical protein
MLTPIIALAVFAFLYGFVWHNQPARETENKRHPKPK